MIFFFRFFFLFFFALMSLLFFFLLFSFVFLIKNEPPLPLIFFGAPLRLRDAGHLVPSERFESAANGGESSSDSDSSNCRCLFFPPPCLLRAQVPRRRPFLFLSSCRLCGPVARREEACDPDDELVGERRGAHSGAEKREKKEKKKEKKTKKKRLLSLSLSRTLLFNRSTPGGGGSWLCRRRSRPRSG